MQETAQPDYPSSRVRYAHTREVDTFHEVPIPGGSGRRKIRVTRDQRDETKVLRVLQKERIADMNVFSPKRLFDWRLSVSMELPGKISIFEQFLTLELTIAVHCIRTSAQSKPCLTSPLRLRGSKIASLIRIRCLQLI